MEHQDKFWNFTARNALSNRTAELVLYGEIASRQSWSEDKITPQLFHQELEELGDVEHITVRLNSGGGDISAADTIGTRLRDHPAKITVKVDGWMASSAILVGLAADPGELYIPENGKVFIHNPSVGISGYFEEKDLEGYISMLKIHKEAMILAYAKRTGKKAEELSKLMDEQTWWTGKEAVEHGFCDKLMFQEVQVSVENSGFAIVNEVPMDLSSFSPDQQKYIVDTHEKPKDLPQPINNTKQKKKETKGMETITNANQLETQFPELVKEIRNSATQAERERIQEIEHAAIPGYEEIISKAKFGEPKDSGAVALEILQAQKEQSKNYLEKREKDITNSGVAQVTGHSQEGFSDGTGSLGTAGVRSTGQEAINSIYDELEQEETK